MGQQPNHALLSPLLTFSSIVPCIPMPKKPYQPFNPNVESGGFLVATFQSHLHVWSGSLFSVNIDPFTPKIL